MSTPILKSLAEHRILYVKRKGNLFELREACDGNFYDELTADQLRELGREMIALADTEFE